MPLIVWLGSLLVTLFTSLFTLFMQYASKRLLIIAAVVGAASVFTLGFFALMVALMHQISLSAPPFLSDALGLVVPANLPLIVSIVATARIARWAYEWNIKVLQWKL